MLRGLPCRSAGLTKSAGACSTASSCCSPARGSWTGSATSSWTASFVASTRIKYAMQQIRTQCKAWAPNAMKRLTQLAWSVSSQEQLLTTFYKEKSMARANYKQNPNLQTWSSNTINQRTAKVVKHASQIFPTINDDRKHLSYPEKQLNNK